MNNRLIADSVLTLLHRHGLLERLAFASAEFAALALAVGTLIIVFRLRQPRLRALLWLMVLAKPLVGLVVGTPLPLFFLPAPAAPVVAAHPAPTEPYAPAEQPKAGAARAPEELDAPERGVTLDLITNVPAAPDVPAAPIPKSVSRPWDADAWAHGLWAFWIVGGLFFAGRLAFNFIRLRRLIRAAAPATPWLAGRLAAAARQLQIARPPRLLITKELESPALAGVGRPVILLPEWVAAEADPVRVDWSLRHELMHWRLRDPLAAFLCEVVLILFFFHPAAWWAGRKWKEATELACDRALIRSMEDAASYAEELFRMLKTMHRGRRIRVAGGLFAGRTQIARRIASLARDPLRTPARLSALGLCAVIALSSASMLLFGVGVSSPKTDAAKTLSSPQPGLLLNGVAPKKSADERVQIQAKTITLEKDGRSLRLEGNSRYGIDFGAFPAVVADTGITAVPGQNGFVTLTVEQTPLALRERRLIDLAQTSGTAGNRAECIWMSGDKVEIDPFHKECRPQGNAVLVQKKAGELSVYRSSIIFLHEDAAGQPQVGIGKAIGGYKGPALSVIKLNPAATRIGPSQTQTTSQEFIITHEPKPSVTGKNAATTPTLALFDQAQFKSMETSTTGITILRGDIRIENKKLKIACDVLRIDNRTKMMYAEGNPVRMEQITGMNEPVKDDTINRIKPETGTPTTLECRKLTYNLTTRSALLEGEALIVQTKNGQKTSIGPADSIKMEYPAAQSGQDQEKEQPKISIYNRPNHIRGIEIKAENGDRKEKNKPRSTSATPAGGTGSMDLIKMPSPTESFLQGKSAEQP